MIQPDPPYRPSASDKQAPVWGALMAHLTKRLNTLRVENEGNRTPEETAKLRGRIAEVKALMALDKDVPRPE